jgi:ElaB/YqjD/DUF883 family membrane-anchored ribosome-binding protein
MSKASDQIQGEKSEGGTREPDEIQADIEQTRKQLGDTAAAVAEKADVKAQASAKVEEVTDQAATKAKEVAPESVAPTIEKAQRFVNEKPLVVIGVALVTVVAVRRLLSR